MNPESCIVPNLSPDSLKETNDDRREAAKVHG
jgi:hypothetical protein